MIQNWLMELLNGEGSNERVTPKSILKIPAMWYAVNKICSHVGQLPIDLKRALKPMGAETLDGDPRWRLMRKKPNGYQTPAVFKEMQTAHMLIMGDARSYIARRGSRIVEYIPLNPYVTATGMVAGEKVHVTKVDPDSRLAVYVQADPRNDNKAVFMDDEVLHLPNLSIDGVTGERLFDVAANTIKAAVGADNRVAKTMGKGFTGKVMLEAPPGSFARDDKKAQEFIDEFRKRHQSDQDGEDVGLLREGIKANVLQMSNSDSQFIEQRAFMRQEAALLFLLESIMGDDTSVSYNSLEQKTLAYMQNCLNRWLKRWEEELDAKTLSESEQGNLFYRVNTRSLLRSDLASTMEAINKGIMSRVINPNEARDLLDMNPYEGGDDYFNPAIGNGSAKGQELDKDGKPISKAFNVAETIQKIYLGVGKCVTSDEARAIINEAHETDLAIPGPEFAAANAGQTGARGAIVNRLQELLTVEENRVNQYLSQANPMKKIEKFYSGWQKTLGDAVEAMGGSRKIAEDHCTESIEALLTGADCHKAVNTAEQLADLILKGVE